MFTILDSGKELKKLENFDKDEYIAKLENEVARFIRNADLHVINHQKMYNELRKTKHTLWTTRATILKACWKYQFNFLKDKPMAKEDIPKWQWAERKCLLKAKTFQ